MIGFCNHKAVILKRICLYERSKYYSLGEAMSCVRLEDYLRYFLSRYSDGTPYPRTWSAGGATAVFMMGSN